MNFGAVWHVSCISYTDNDSDGDPDGADGVVVFTVSRSFGVSSQTEDLDMKMISAVIKPFKLDEVRDALTALGIQGMTVSEVKGFGRQRGQTEIYRGAEYTISFVPKVAIDVVVTDDQAEGAIEAIRTAAAAGQIGDGKIFVVEVAQAVRIRTGETDAEAL